MKEFWEKGYTILPGLVTDSITKQALAALTSLQLKYQPICKQVFGEKYDDSVMQAHMPIRSIPACMNLGVVITREIIKKQPLMRWKAVEWVVLKSLPGGGEQQARYDFPSGEISRAWHKYSSVQAGLMVGLMPNTKLIVYDSCFAEANPRKQKTITYGAGDAVLFRGDLVHAEAPYDVLNYRIRATLIVQGIDWGKKESEIAPAPTFKCKHCPFRATTNREIYNHNRFCPENPTKSEIVARYKTLNEIGKTCSICSKHFAKANTFYQHRARKHRQVKTLN